MEAVIERLPRVEKKPPLMLNMGIGSQHIHAFWLK
jgi:hypothetical protein